MCCRNRNLVPLIITFLYFENYIAAIDKSSFVIIEQVISTPEPVLGIIISNQWVLSSASHIIFDDAVKFKITTESFRIIPCGYTDQDRRNNQHNSHCVYIPGHIKHTKLRSSSAAKNDIALFVVNPPLTMQPQKVTIANLHLTGWTHDLEQNTCDYFIIDPSRKIKKTLISIKKNCTHSGISAFELEYSFCTDNTNSSGFGETVTRGGKILGIRLFTHSTIFTYIQPYSKWIEDTQREYSNQFVFIRQNLLHKDAKEVDALGIIISDRWVLSSASHIQLNDTVPKTGEITNEKFNITPCGYTEDDRKNNYHESHCVYIPKEFKYEDVKNNLSFKNDLALFVIDPPLYPKICKISIAEIYPHPWNASLYNNDSTDFYTQNPIKNKTVQVATVNIRTECKAEKLPENERNYCICATNTFTGYGETVTYKGKIIGIRLFNHESIFTYVPSYSTWIDDVKREHYKHQFVFISNNLLKPNATETNALGVIISNKWVLSSASHIQVNDYDPNTEENTNVKFKITPCGYTEDDRKNNYHESHCVYIPKEFNYKDVKKNQSFKHDIALFLINPPLYPKTCKISIATVYLQRWNYSSEAGKSYYWNIKSLHNYEIHPFRGIGIKKCELPAIEAAELKDSFCTNGTSSDGYGEAVTYDHKIIGIRLHRHKTIFTYILSYYEWINNKQRESYQHQFVSISRNLKMLNSQKVTALGNIISERWVLSSASHIKFHETPKEEKITDVEFHITPWVYRKKDETIYKSFCVYIPSGFDYDNVTNLRAYSNDIALFLINKPLKFEACKISIAELYPNAWDDTLTRTNSDYWQIEPLDNFEIKHSNTSIKRTVQSAGNTKNEDCCFNTTRSTSIGFGDTVICDGKIIGIRVYNHTDRFTYIQNHSSWINNKQREHYQHQFVFIGENLKIPNSIKVTALGAIISDRWVLSSASHIQLDSKSLKEGEIKDVKFKITPCGSPFSHYYSEVVHIRKGFELENADRSTAVKNDIALFLINEPLKLEACKISIAELYPNAWDATLTRTTNNDYWKMNQDPIEITHTHGFLLKRKCTLRGILEKKFDSTFCIDDKSSSGYGEIITHDGKVIGIRSFDHKSIFTILSDHQKWIDDVQRKYYNQFVFISQNLLNEAAPPVKALGIVISDRWVLSSASHIELPNQIKGGKITNVKFNITPCGYTRQDRDKYTFKSTCVYINEQFNSEKVRKSEAAKSDIALFVIEPTLKLEAGKIEIAELYPTPWNQTLESSSSNNNDYYTIKQTGNYELQISTITIQKKCTLGALTTSDLEHSFSIGSTSSMGYGETVTRNGKILGIRLYKHKKIFTYTQSYAAWINTTQHDYYSHQFVFISKNLLKPDAPEENALGVIIGDIWVLSSASHIELVGNDTKGGRITNVKFNITPCGYSDQKNQEGIHKSGCVYINEGIDYKRVRDNKAAKDDIALFVVNPPLYSKSCKISIAKLHPTQWTRDLENGTNQLLKMKSTSKNEVILVNEITIKKKTSHVNIAENEFTHAFSIENASLSSSVPGYGDTIIHDGKIIGIRIYKHKEIFTYIQQYVKWIKTTQRDHYKQQFVYIRHNDTTELNVLGVIISYHWALSSASHLKLTGADQHKEQITSMKFGIEPWGYTIQERNENIHTSSCVFIPKEFKYNDVKESRSFKHDIALFAVDPPLYPITCKIIIAELYPNEWNAVLENSFNNDYYKIITSVKYEIKTSTIFITKECSRPNVNASEFEDAFCTNDTSSDNYGDTVTTQNGKVLGIRVFNHKTCFTYIQKYSKWIEDTLRNYYKNQFVFISKNLLNPNALKVNALGNIISNKWVLSSASHIDLGNNDKKQGKITTVEFDIKPWGLYKSNHKSFCVHIPKEFKYEDVKKNKSFKYDLALFRVQPSFQPKQCEIIIANWYPSIWGKDLEGSPNNYYTINTTVDHGIQTSTVAIQKECKAAECDDSKFEYIFGVSDNSSAGYGETVTRDGKVFGIRVYKHNQCFTYVQLHDKWIESIIREKCKDHFVSISKNLENQGAAEVNVLGTIITDRWVLSSASHIQFGDTGPKPGENKNVKFDIVPFGYSDTEKNQHRHTSTCVYIHKKFKSGNLGKEDGPSVVPYDLALFKINPNFFHFNPSIKNYNMSFYENSWDGEHIDGDLWGIDPINKTLSKKETTTINQVECVIPNVSKEQLKSYFCSKSPSAEPGYGDTVLIDDKLIGLRAYNSKDKFTYLQGEYRDWIKNVTTPSNTTYTSTTDKSIDSTRDYVDRTSTTTDYKRVSDTEYKNVWMVLLVAFAIATIVSVIVADIIIM